MRTLPYDVSRCSGRLDLTPDGEDCPFKDQCKRYLALVYWDKVAEIPDYRGIPVTVARKDCEIILPMVDTTQS